MEEGRASESAEGAAALRADHRLHDEPLVFDDAFALELLGPRMREMVETGAFRRILEERELRPTQGGIVSRARHAEDELARAVAEGIRQFVLIGAGLDSFLLRRPAFAAELGIFELDFPATQADKRERLAKLSAPVSDRCVFVPVDFERQSLPEALAPTPFDPSVPAFFSWLGVVTYLTRDAILETLRGVREASAVGSEIVFDYPIPRERLGDHDRRVAEEKSAALAAGGEPRLLTFDPEELAEALRGIGFEVVAQLSVEEIQSRHFRGRDDGLRANPENWLGHFRTR